MRHKHADLIIEWANGAQIQYYDITMHRWEDDANPKWREETNFRVKPEPKPDVETQYYASIYSVYPAKHFNRIPNLKITFDGETGELKAAEVLK